MLIEVPNEFKSKINKHKIPAGHKFVFGGSQTQFGRRRRTPAVQIRKYERLRRSRVEISEEKVEAVVD